jgi:hypothetical protein
MESNAAARDDFVGGASEAAGGAIDSAVRGFESKTDMLTAQPLGEHAEPLGPKAQMTGGGSVEAKRELVDTLSAPVDGIGEAA